MEVSVLGIPGTALLLVSVTFASEWLLHCRKLTLTVLVTTIDALQYFETG